MHMNQRLAFVIPVLLILVGAGLAFDHRFIPMVTLFNKPLFVALVYCPTMFFALFTLSRLRRRGVGSLTAFGIGLIGTGLFHHFVLAETYANPGYMVPIGHLAAPIVSSAAYIASFLGVWSAGKALGRIQGSKENDAAAESPRKSE